MAKPALSDRLAALGLAVPPAPNKPWTNDLAEIGRQAVGSFAVGVPQQAGQALKWASQPGQPAYESGQQWVEGAEQRAPAWEPDLAGRGPIATPLIKAAQQIGPSVAGPLTAAAALAASPVAPVVGLGIGALAGAVPMGMAQGQDTMERVLNAGGTPEEARRAGRLNQAIETGGETLGNVAFGGLLGAGGRALRRGAEKPVAEALRSVTDPSVLKPFAKAALQTYPVEMGTEFGQGYGEAAVEQAAGVPGVDPLAQGLEGAQIAAGMTTLGLPVGALGHTVQARRNAGVAEALSNPEADPAQRVKAADLLARQMDQVDPAAGMAVRENAAHAIAAKLALPLDETIAAPGLFLRGGLSNGTTTTGGQTTGPAPVAGVVGSVGGVPGTAPNLVAGGGVGPPGGVGGAPTGGAALPGRTGAHAATAVDPATGEIVTVPAAPRGAIGRAADVAEQTGAVAAAALASAPVAPASGTGAIKRDGGTEGGAMVAQSALSTPPSGPSGAAPGGGAANVPPTGRNWQIVPDERGNPIGAGTRTEDIGGQKGSAYIAPTKDGQFALRAAAMGTQRGAGVIGDIFQSVFPDEAAARVAGEQWLSAWETGRRGTSGGPQTTEPVQPATKPTKPPVAPSPLTPPAVEKTPAAPAAAPGTAPVKPAGYDERSSDRIQHTTTADDDGLTAIWKEELADSERHFEGTSKLQAAINERKYRRGLEQRAAEREAKEHAGEWVSPPNEIHAALQKRYGPPHTMDVRAAAEALNAEQSEFEYRANWDMRTEGYNELQRRRRPSQITPATADHVDAQPVTPTHTTPTAETPDGQQEATEKAQEQPLSGRGASAPAGGERQPTADQVAGAADGARAVTPLTWEKPTATIRPSRIVEPGTLTPGQAERPTTTETTDGQKDQTKAEAETLLTPGDYGRLAGRKVTRQARDEATGASAQITEDAAAMLRDYDQRLATLEALLECVQR